MGGGASDKMVVGGGASDKMVSSDAEETAKGSPKEAGQLTLDFDHRPALGAEDFLVAPSNADAVGWLDAWPDWPGPALVITGPPGSGKTHLARVFLSTAEARPVTPVDLAVDDPVAHLAEAPACVLDDAEKALAQGLTEPLLHLYNYVAETGRHLLLTGGQPPSRWDITLDDLASRLNAAAQARIGPPDDALIAQVLVKQFADRQLMVADDVISFLLARMERSFEAARRIVAGVDRLALKERRKITVPLVRRVLDRQPPNED